MIRYNLAELAAQRRATFTEATLPPQSPRLGTSRRYAVALRKVISGIRQEVNRTVIPVYEAERRLMRDADETTFSSVEAAAEQLNRTAELMARRILDLEAERHSAEFIDKARQALGVDLTAVVRKNDLENLMRQATARNVSLIKSLSADAIKDVKQTVYNAGIKGDSVTALRTLLAQRYNVAASRADLIAQDQTSKFVADMNEFRQRQAGISEYDWMTSADERVRPRHQAIDGKRYKWGEATGAENGDPPGKPIRCRCVARGVVAWKRAKPVAPTRVKVDKAALDFEARAYVLERGRASGIEQLVGFDQRTGEQTDRPTGTSNFVAFTPLMLRWMADKKRRLVMHHNHPSSSSFSVPDINETHRNPGVVELWAHGHNGSSYKVRRVKPGTVDTTTGPAFAKVRADVIARIMAMNDMRLLTAEIVRPDGARGTVGMVLAHHAPHIAMLVMERRGLLKYEAKLTWSKAEREALEPWINSIVESLTDAN